MFKRLFRWIFTLLGMICGAGIFFLAAYLLRLIPAMPEISETWSFVLGVICIAATGLIFFIIAPHVQKGSEKFAQELDVSLRRSTSSYELICGTIGAGARTSDRFPDQCAVGYAECACLGHRSFDSRLHIFRIYRNIYRPEKIKGYRGGPPPDDRGKRDAIPPEEIKQRASIRQLRRFSIPASLSNRKNCGYHEDRLH